jgi:hypothetical protein
MRFDSFRNLFKKYFVGIRNAEHRLGLALLIFHRAEAVLGAPNVGKSSFAEVSFRIGVKLCIFNQIGEQPV